MTGLTFFILTLLLILSTTDGLRQCKCSMPCSNREKTSCPPGYRCKLKKERHWFMCYKCSLKITDYPDKCYQVGLGRLYNGRVSETVKGVKCQRWDSSTPHVPYSSLIHADKFPERSVYEASNYCRDPSNTGRPWCYTTDPDDRWDYCKIPSCSSRNCYRRGFAFLYQGNTAVTEKDKPCQRWDASYPHKHKYLDADNYPDKSLKEANNFCRSPEKSARPWCYTTSTVRWQYCKIEECPYNYCYDKAVSWKYAGTEARTQGGIKCQSWDSNVPHNHKYGSMPHKFPENDVSSAKNYCRDPSWSGRPWCYTTEVKKRWDWCCINQCSDLK